MSWVSDVEAKLVWNYSSKGPYFETVNNLFVAFVCSSSWSWLLSVEKVMKSSTSCLNFLYSDYKNPQIVGKMLGNYCKEKCNWRRNVKQQSLEIFLNLCHSASALECPLQKLHICRIHVNKYLLQNGIIEACVCSNFHVHSVYCKKKTR